VTWHYHAVQYWSFLREGHRLGSGYLFFLVTWHRALQYSSFLREGHRLGSGYSSPLPTPNITFPIFHPSSNNTFRVFPLLLINQYHSSYTQPCPLTPSHLQMSATTSLPSLRQRYTVADYNFFRRHLGLHVMRSWIEFWFVNVVPKHVNSSTLSKDLLSSFILWLHLEFWPRNMNMYLVLSAFTSSPVSLLRTIKVSAFSFMVRTLPPNILTSSA